MQISILTIMFQHKETPVFRFDFSRVEVTRALTAEIEPYALLYLHPFPITVFNNFRKGLSLSLAICESFAGCLTISEKVG